jgi:uncharacterized membrane protein (UPF0127 family)
MGALRIDRRCRAAGVITAVPFALQPRLMVADRVITRAVGVLGTPDLRTDEALILLPCAAVHGIGLRCAIGAAFVDRQGVVLHVVDPLPWWGARVRGAYAVIEARAGVLAALVPGDTVEVDDETIFPLRGNFALR